MHDSLLISSAPLDLNNESCFNLTFDVGSGKVSDVNILDLDIDIIDAGAIVANLISPAGTQINLIRDLCDGQPNILVTLDDGAQNSIADANCAPLGNGLRFRPLEAFDAFCGEQAEGEWMLQVYLEEDVAATINNADLQVLTVEPYEQEDIVRPMTRPFAEPL